MRQILALLLLAAALQQAWGQPASLTQAADDARAQYADPAPGSWPPCTDADAAVVERASDYVIGLLNLRQVVLHPTTLERVIAAYKAPFTTLNGQPTPQRYWLAMQVSQQGDGFVLMVETYQDELRNWQAVLPSASKNFKASGTSLLHDLATELWFARFLDDEVVVSCLKAVRLVLENGYFPLVMPGVAMTLDRLVHAETREDASGPAAVRALEGEVGRLRGRLAALESLRAAHARTLARALASKREALRRAAQRARDGDVALGSEAVEAFRGDVEQGERALEGAEAERVDVEERLRRAEAMLRQAQATGAGGLSAATHVFLVCDFVDAASLQASPLPVPNPTLQRRQVVMFSQDWRRFGTPGWQLVEHHPFDLAAPLAATPGYVAQALAA